MAMKNKYAKRSRLSEGKVREVVRYVATDVTALQDPSGSPAATGRSRAGGP